MSVPDNTGLWTVGQTNALATLRRNYAVKCLMPMVGAVRLRTHTLLVGTTGVGKTAVVQRFAKEMNMEMLSVACNSWIPYGANTQPCTLYSLGDFLSSGEPKVLFLDEVDKTIPVSAAYGSSWSLGVFGEVLALLDADGRLKNFKWTDAHIAGLSRAFIIGAGAFQNLADDQKKTQAHIKPPVGFMAEDTANGDHLHYSQSVYGKGLPPEIASRFCADVLVLPGPTVEEYKRGIEQLHRGRRKGKPDVIAIQRLAEEAVRSGHGMRWFESYAMGIAAERVGKMSEKCVERPGLFPLRNKLPSLAMNSVASNDTSEPASSTDAPSSSPSAATQRPPHIKGRTIEKSHGNPPVMPVQWKQAVEPMANQYGVRCRALAAARSLRELIWHANLHSKQLENGENEMFGNDDENPIMRSSNLLILLGATQWSLEDYWRPQATIKDLYGHEHNFGYIPTLIRDLERNLESYALEYSNIGLGKYLLDTTSSMREFAVEWALWTSKHESPEEPEW